MTRSDSTDDDSLKENFLNMLTLFYDYKGSHVMKGSPTINQIPKEYLTLIFVCKDRQTFLRCRYKETENWVRQKTFVRYGQKH